MKEQWVVTYRIETEDGVTIMEFFRGTPWECRRIQEHSSGGECDSGPTTQPWGVIIGPAKDWDEFLARAMDMPGVEAITLEAA
jgi:hypothetical protein